MNGGFEKLISIAQPVPAAYAAGTGSFHGQEAKTLIIFCNNCQKSIFILTNGDNLFTIKIGVVKK